VSPVAYLLLGAVVAAIAYVAWRATIVFELHADAGRVARARGRMPAELFRELSDVLGRAKATGRVRGRLASGEVRLEVAGAIGPDVEQRLRNVTGRFPAARIKTGPKIGH
jgi:hypothetical protein